MSIYDEHERVFMEWLLANGARFPKLEWPCVCESSGSRGTVAKEDIATNEVMLEIPISLLMCEPNFKNDPTIGNILKDCGDFLNGDIQLSVFIMNEMKKGSLSFYHPFLQIIPPPDCIVEWSSAELDTLQDSDLASRARSKFQYLKHTYDTTVAKLTVKYPQVFSKNDFSFEHFRFAWHAIMSRAFGKRLSFSAMVPFADCLNHHNVQTKYDFNVDGNGLFRMFPSGTNSYKKGMEVYNSYGRRKNENLLMEYGFALLDNDWETVTLLAENFTSDGLHQRKSSLLFAMKVSMARGIHVRRIDFPLEALRVLRVVTADETTVTQLEQKRVNFTAMNASTTESPLFNVSIISLESELVAAQKLRELLKQQINLRATPLDIDVETLKQLAQNVVPPEFQNVNKVRVMSGLVYRITRKRIVNITLERCEELISFLEFALVKKAAKFLQDEFFQKLWFVTSYATTDLSSRSEEVSSKEKEALMHYLDELYGIVNGK